MSDDKPTAHSPECASWAGGFTMGPTCDCRPTAETCAQEPCICRRWLNCDDYHAHSERCVQITQTARPDCKVCRGTGLVPAPKPEEPSAGALRIAGDHYADAGRVYALALAIDEHVRREVEKAKRDLLETQAKDGRYLPHHTVGWLVVNGKVCRKRHDDFINDPCVFEEMGFSGDRDAWKWKAEKAEEALGRIRLEHAAVLARRDTALGRVHFIACPYADSTDSKLHDKLAEIARIAKEALDAKAE